MPDQDRPQIYLIAPTDLTAGAADRVARVMDSTEIACMRLALPGTDADTVARAADLLQPMCHARDVALVVADHLVLAERHGLDGVHLSDGSRGVRAARKALGPDAIVGSFCGTSRHDGLTAGEAGADYISFGPVGDSGLGDGSRAPDDLFAWWSEMIELPVVAEGALDAHLIRGLAPRTDFFGIGPEIWQAEDPAAALAALAAAMG